MSKLKELINNNNPANIPAIEVWEQLKYSTDRVCFLMKKNEKIKEDLSKYVGKPIYQGMLELIEKHEKEIKEEKKICTFYFKKI